MTRNLTVLLASALALGGCALDTRIPRPDVHVPAAFEANQAAATTDSAALDRWWLLFSDDQLNALIAQALAASPDAKSAMGRLREADATARETLFGLLPQGDVRGSAAEQHVTTKYQGVPAQYQSFLGAFSQAGNNEVYSGGLNVSWELDLWGRDFAAIGTARAEMAAARFDYEATRMSLAAAVATQLFQARGLAIQLQDARENARLAGELAVVSRKKADHGLGSTADAARLEADEASAEAQSTQVEALLRGAQRTLLVLIGRGGDPSSSLPVEPKVVPPPAPPITAPGDLLARRPDVRAAEARVRSAAGRLRIDKLAVLPTINLQPSFSYSRQDAQFTTITTTGSAGVGVTVPFLGLPKILQEIRAQGARGEQAVAAYEKAVQTAYGDAEKGLTTVKADQRQIALLREATDKSRFAYAAARKGYDLGLADLTTLIQAEEAWRATRARLTSASTSALVDTVSTFKALGGGWPANGGPATAPQGGAR